MRYRKMATFDFGDLVYNFSTRKKKTRFKYEAFSENSHVRFKICFFKMAAMFDAK